MWAISLYTLVIFSLLQGWLFPTFCLVLVYSFVYNSITLIPLAILMDGYFGNFYTVPVLSFLAVLWYIVVEYLRPKIANFKTT
jgi:hypothetical protein